MECTACTNKYDVLLRRPKVLKCGHTFCKPCVGAVLHLKPLEMILCPICRTETPVLPSELPTNLLVLDILDELSQLKKKSVKKWCLDCRKEADGICVDKHTVCPLRTERTRQMKVTKSVLTKAIHSRRTLQLKMRGDLSQMMVAYTSQLKAIGESCKDAEEALKLLDSSMEAENQDWESIVKRIKKAESKYENVSSMPGGQTLNLENLSQSQGQNKEKAALFVQHVPAVTKVHGLHCDKVSSFAKWILYCHGPTLEYLELKAPSAEHLAAVLAMPNLRSLSIGGGKGVLLNALQNVNPESEPVIALENLRMWEMGMSPKEIEGLIELFRGARSRLSTVWQLGCSGTYAGEKLAQFLKNQSASAKFSMPKAIELFCSYSTTPQLGPKPSREQCSSMCSAVRDGLDSVDVWCTRHELKRASCVLSLSTPW